MFLFNLKWEISTWHFVGTFLERVGNLESSVKWQASINFLLTYHTRIKFDFADETKENVFPGFWMYVLSGKRKSQIFFGIKALNIDLALLNGFFQKINFVLTVFLQRLNKANHERSKSKTVFIWFPVQKKTKSAAHNKIALSGNPWNNSTVSKNS